MRLCVCFVEIPLSLNKIRCLLIFFALNVDFSISYKTFVNNVFINPTAGITKSLKLFTDYIFGQQRIGNTMTYAS